MLLSPYVTTRDTEPRLQVSEHLQQASELMAHFAERTGLSSERPGQRYLWTDAFAVCNLVGLSHAFGAQEYTRLAQRLVDSVHFTLGRHRLDDVRKGWLSGLSESEGKLHPTRGGLRIGKTLPERPAGEPPDERREWDRDGQYFHYLTKWMHALDQLSRSTRQAHLNQWAMELAQVAHARFVVRPAAGPPHMMWKMSIDLSRPQVASMGQHDALDGFITCVELTATAQAFHVEPDASSLTPALASFAAMMHAGQLVTPDPLGLGGLLMDACRVTQLVQGGTLPDDALLLRLLEAVLLGTRYYAQQREFQGPAARRIPFRELGLAIGLSALAPITALLEAGATVFAQRSTLRGLLDALATYAPLGPFLLSFWLDAEHRRAPTWREHLDINEVMLASALAPDGVLLMLPFRAP